jgi:hypothetical protein
MRRHARAFRRLCCHPHPSERAARWRRLGLFCSCAVLDPSFRKPNQARFSLFLVAFDRASSCCFAHEALRPTKHGRERPQEEGELHRFASGLNAALQVRSKGRAARLAAIGLTPFVDSNHFVCMGLRQSDQRTCVLVAKFSVRLPLTGPTSEQRGATTGGRTRNV